jgi:DNA-binding transcriptional regulator YdaS (Cro superfamily)
MHSKQYLVVSLACISFAAILLLWLMEPTLRQAVNALK